MFLAEYFDPPKEYRYINPLPLAFNYVPKLIFTPAQAVPLFETNLPLKPIGAAAMIPNAETQKIEKEVEKQADAANDNDSVAVEAA